MSSFTKPLIVEKVGKQLWKTHASFEYHVGDENSNDIITVPEGFPTDFASVPRIFWSILPPDGQYAQSAVLHDFLYSVQKYSRKRCDQIFLESMKVLKVSLWRRAIIYRAVRMFGWLAWKMQKAESWHFSSN